MAEMKTDAYSQVRRGAGRITGKCSAFSRVVNGKYQIICQF